MEQSFDQIIRSDKPVLVDFYMPACIPCEKMVPILDAVKQSLGTRISVVKVDINRYADLAATYKIRYVPTIMLFQKGTKLWQQSGLLSKAEILGTILQESN